MQLVLMLLFASVKESAGKKNRILPENILGRHL